MYTNQEDWIWTKKTKNNWPLPSCRFSCPVNIGRTKPLQNAKNWPASAYPWSIDIKKEPALALAQTYSISPSSSWPEAPSTKSPAGGICNWFPSLTHERHPRQLTLLGCPSPTALCCAVESHLFPLFTKVLFFTLFFRHETKTLK